MPQPFLTATCCVSKSPPSFPNLEVLSRVKLERALFQHIDNRRDHRVPLVPDSLQQGADPVGLRLAVRVEEDQHVAASCARASDPRGYQPLAGRRVVSAGHQIKYRDGPNGTS